MSFKPTPEQQAILDFARETKTNLSIQALAGAAKTSFLKKCERDAAATAPAADAAKEACEKTAAEKKLAGAAKNSFVTKCVKDAAAAK